MANPDSPERQLLQSLMDLHKMLEANLQKQALGMGLSLPQIAVFRDVADHPESGLQDVVDRLGLPKSSVSRLVDELVHKGLVTRAIPDDDRRAVRLSPVENAACLPMNWDEVFLDRGLFSDGRLAGVLGSLDEIKKTISG